MEEPKNKSKNVALDILEIFGEGVGLVASPSTVATIVLLNTLGVTQGFNGHKHK